MTDFSEFDAFDCRASINDGVKVDLTLPDGSPSGHWLKVRNFRSDEYRKTLASIHARAAESGQGDEAQKRADRLNLVAALIAGWSFKAEPTHDNVVAFLERAPLVPEQIDRVMVDDARFFGNGAKPSSDGLPKS